VLVFDAVEGRSIATSSCGLNARFLVPALEVGRTGFEPRLHILSNCQRQGSEEGLGGRKVVVTWQTIPSFRPSTCP